ncbi:MAG TPA: hypothetical protein HA269_03335 [Ferroplasma sp.]|nr:hypothetical protein [Ferroplasma sp.]
MKKNSLPNIRKIISSYKYTAKDLMTDWKDMVFNEGKDDYDFVPKLDNTNNVSSILVRKDDKYFESKSVLYISENSHLINVLEKMDIAFNNKCKTVRLTFLIVTNNNNNNNNNNAGFINHNDFNKPVFALFLWQIFYVFESILANYIKSNIDPSTTEKYIKYPKRYNNDKKNKVNLHPIYYISLGTKLELYKKEFKNPVDPLCIMQLPTANLTRFRNHIAHPGDKPKIIKQKRDIKDLFELLKSLDNWIISPAVFPLFEDKIINH